MTAPSWPVGLAWRVTANELVPYGAELGNGASFEREGKATVGGLILRLVVPDLHKNCFFPCLVPANALRVGISFLVSILRAPPSEGFLFCSSFGRYERRVEDRMLHSSRHLYSPLRVRMLSRVDFAPPWLRVVPGLDRSMTGRCS